MRGSPFLLVLFLGSGLGGCVHKDVVVDPSQVYRRIPELRTEGKAEIEGKDVTGRTRVVARSKNGWLTQQRTVTIAKLIENCPDIVPWGPSRRRATRECMLLRTDTVKLGKRVDWGESAALWGGATLAVVAAGVVIGVLVDANSRPQGNPQ